MLKSISMYRIESPCKKCQCKNHQPACRTTCGSLDEFLQEMNFIISYGVSDTTDDGYKLMPL